jgi:signal transduction histidine kinase
MYGGTVTVEDNQPRGSVFVVILDRVSAGPETQP